MTANQLDSSIILVERIFSMLRTTYFVCFGALLGIIRDDGVLTGDNGNPVSTEDLDIGVMFEDVDERRLVSSFRKFGYDLYKVFRSDIDNKPLHMAFVKKGDPTIDIFSWVLHGGFRYHTYDINREGCEIPKNGYVFKGVPHNWLISCTDWQLRTLPQMKGERPIDMKVSGIKSKVKIPVQYGHCLDEWYPNWMRKRSGVQSVSKWTRTVKSCGEVYASSW